jgi:hypothetical protein
MTRAEFFVAVLYTIIFNYLFDFAWHHHWLSSFTATLVYPLGLALVWGRIWLRRNNLGWFSWLLPVKPQTPLPRTDLTD